MKKNYFSTFFAALMLLVAMPATAQVSSMSDLLGKYQFSATITPTKDGQSFTDWWVSECEVTIDSETILDDNNQVVETSTSINGFLGATQKMLAGRLDTDKCEFYVGEPNPGYGLLDPYNGVGIADPELEMKDFTLTFKYDPQTKEITIPDFSINLLTFNNNEFTKGKELAKVTNAKLTFAGEFTVADLSGDWHFVAGDGEYDTMAGSTLPTEWDMTLTATDEYNKAYDVNFVLGDFAPLALTATFDGQKLLVAFDNAYFDVENMISLGDYSSTAAASEFEFTLSSENELTLNYGMCIVGEKPSFSLLQYYGAGVATRSAAEEEETFDWTGTYTVTVGEIVVENDDYTYPETFEMEIIYDDTYGPEYVITKFFGQDVTFGYNQYGWGLSAYPTDVPNQICINLDLANGLVDFGDGTYLLMYALDGNWKELAFTEENGVVTIDNFQVMHYADGGIPTLVATYKNITAVKKEVEASFWANTFIVKAGKVTVYNEEFTYPTEFEMEVQFSADHNKHFVTKFFGQNQDIVDLNEGGLLLMPSTDPNVAKINPGFLQTIVADESYLALLHTNLDPSSSITITRHEDGTFTMDNFSIGYLTWNMEEETTHITQAALYEQVTLTLKSTSVDNMVVEDVIEGIFDLLGRKLDAITAPGLYIVNGKKVIVK